MPLAIQPECFLCDQYSVKFIHGKQQLRKYREPSSQLPFPVVLNIYSDYSDYCLRQRSKSLDANTISILFGGARLLIFKKCENFSFQAICLRANKYDSSSRLH